jgi:hypothetical protein
VGEGARQQVQEAAKDQEVSISQHRDLMRALQYRYCHRTDGFKGAGDFRKVHVHPIHQALLAASLAAAPAYGLELTNGIPAGTVGHLSLDVMSGGETRQANATVQRQASGDIFTEDIVYDYFSYVIVGNTGFRLDGSDPAPAGAGAVASSGSFTGALGNIIHWNVTTILPPGATVWQNVVEFQAESGTLGELRFVQYLDEDLEDNGDDVFFTRGSAASNDLELFTIDHDEVYGISHGGAYFGSGLTNAAFAGWAVDVFDEMRPVIAAGSLAVSPEGEVNEAALPLLIHADLGEVRGPRDIVSALAWDVDPLATYAKITTTAGGIVSRDDVPPPRSHPAIPLPAPGWMALSGLVAIGVPAAVYRWRRSQMR